MLSLGAAIDSGCKFQMAHFQPSSGLNQETQKLYASLDSVVQAVLTNKDANIDQLLTDLVPAPRKFEAA